MHEITYTKFCLKMANKNITEAERLELAAKLDKELDEFIDGLEKRPYTEGWPEDRWQEEMEKHPFFMKKAPEPGEELHPLLEGIQQLKYDPLENTPEELAERYKEDGNYNFKHKNYRLAILSYTEGIKIKCDNKDIVANLYNNRSAANYFLKNYRSCLKDCDMALKIKQDYDKVIVRAANCYYYLSYFEKAIECCDKLLKKDKHNKEMLALRIKCVKDAKIKDRNDRKKTKAHNKQMLEENMLIEEIVKKGINIEEKDKDDDLTLAMLEPKFPQLVNHRVFLNDSNNLVWPLVFFYPEYQITDFVEQYPEDEIFKDLIDSMFENCPEWDKNKEYKTSSVNIYYENWHTKKLFRADVGKTLGNIMKSKEFVVRDGTPSFMVLIKDSPMEKMFLKCYT